MNDMSKFEIKTEKLMNVIKAILVMNEKSALTFNKEGLKAAVVSIDRTAMVGVNLPKSEFELYELTADPELTFNLEIKHFKDRLDRCGDKSVIETSDKGVELKSGHKKYSLHTIENQPGGRELPTGVTFMSKITLPVETLKEIMADIKPVTERMKVVTADGRVTFSAKSPDFSDDNVTLTPAVAGVEGTATSHYTLAYMIDMANATTEKNAILEFSTDLALRLTLGNVTYILGSWVANR